MSTEPVTSAELMPVDFIETELTRFTAVIGSVKSKTFGRYGIEFITSRDQKDDVWECTDETGHEVVVVVYKRRVVGVPDPSILDTLDPAILGALRDIDPSWTTADDSSTDGE